MRRVMWLKSEGNCLLHCMFILYNNFFLCVCLYSHFSFQWLPESARYDVLTGNQEKALCTLRRIAMENNVPMPLGKLIAARQVIQHRASRIRANPKSIIVYIGLLMWRMWVNWAHLPCRTQWSRSGHNNTCDIIKSQTHHSSQPLYKINQIKWCKALRCIICPSSVGYWFGNDIICTDYHHGMVGQPWPLGRPSGFKPKGCQLSLHSAAILAMPSGSYWKIRSASPIRMNGEIFKVGRSHWLKK